MTRSYDASLSNNITSTVKDNWAHWKAFMGIPQSSDRLPSGLRAMGQVPADEAWVYAVTDKLAKAAQSVDLRVQVRRNTSTSAPGAPTSRRAQWADVDEAERRDSAGEDLQLLLDDVNQDWHGSGLQTYIEAADDIWGGSYVKKVRGRFGGVPQELHWLPAPNVEAMKGRTFIEAYEYRPDETAAVQIIDALDMIPFRRFNLLDPTVLVSPFEAARWSIVTLKRASEWNAQLLGNYGVPPGAWVADKDTELQPTEVNAIKRALRSIRGSKGAGKIPILPGGMNWVPMSMTQKDADWLGSGKVSRMTICAIAGVPLVIAGDDEHAGVYAGSRDAERIMWRITLIPKLKLRAATWDSSLVPDFDKTRKKLRVRYDWTKVEALKAPPAEEHTAWQHWVDRGVPLNRAIEQFNLGGPVEGGDESKLAMQGAEEENNHEGENATDDEDKPRSESNKTDIGDGKEAIRSMGKKLYQHPAVKAYVDSGDTEGLGALVPDHRLPLLIEGLRQRHSAKQITEDWDEPEATPGVVVNVSAVMEDDAVKAVSEGLAASNAEQMSEVRQEIANTEKTASENSNAVLRAVQDFTQAVKTPPPKRKERRTAHRDQAGRVSHVDIEEL